MPGYVYVLNATSNTLISLTLNDQPLDGTLAHNQWVGSVEYKLSGGQWARTTDEGKSYKPGFGSQNTLRVHYRGRPARDYKIDIPVSQAPIEEYLKLFVFDEVVVLELPGNKNLISQVTGSTEVSADEIPVAQS